MSAGHNYSTEATTSGMGRIKVNLTVRVLVNRQEYQALNLDNQEADVEWTWAEFFQRTGNVTVDPDKFQVKSQRKQPVLMDDKIRNHIAKYKEVRPFYRVNIVTRMRRPRQSHKGSSATREPSSRKKIASRRYGVPPFLANRPSSAHTNKEHIPGRSVFGSSRAAAAATHTRQNQHPNPKRSHADHIQLNNTRPDPKRFKGGARNAQERTLPQQAVNVESEPLRSIGADHRFGLSSGRRVIFEEDNNDDNDDATSQVSQITEYDIRGMGITEEEIKPNVVKKLLQNITNSQLLIAKQELKKYAASKHWMKFAHYNPIAAHILTHFFIGLTVFQIQPLKMGSEIGGGRMLTIKTRVPELLSLNRIIEKVVDLDWTWAEFFQRSSQVMVDPEKYKVHSYHKPPVPIHSKIRELIAMYKRVQKVYHVNVTKRMAVKPKVTHLMSREIEVAGKKILPCATDRQRVLQVLAVPIKKVEEPRVRIELEETSSVEEPPIPCSSKSVRKDQPKRFVKPEACPKRFKPDVNERLPETVEIVGAASRLVESSRLIDDPGFGDLQPMRNNLEQGEDDNDNASQHSAMSLATNLDLEELGITDEDEKMKLMDKLEYNIPNNMLLVARHELKKYAETRHWMRLAQQNPVAASILTHFFIAA